MGLKNNSMLPVSPPNDLQMFNIPSGAQQPHKIPCKRWVFHPKFPFVNVIKFILMWIFQAQKQQHRINLLYTRIYYVVIL